MLSRASLCEGMYTANAVDERSSASCVANRHGLLRVKKGIEDRGFCHLAGKTGEVVKALACFLTKHIHVVRKGRCEKQ